MSKLETYNRRRGAIETLTSLASLIQGGASLNELRRYIGREIAILENQERQEFERSSALVNQAFATLKTEVPQ